MKLRFLPYFCFISIGIFLLSSCLKNDEYEDYSEWRTKNQLFIDEAEVMMEDGQYLYEKISPVWDNNIYVLMHWHNDREETMGNITPVSNSLVRINYTLTNINGDTLDSSASFKCLPNGMITGFWTALTHMHVSDTVTAIIPYTAAYGAFGSGSVPPYSTLVFGIRLDSIISYQKR